MQDIAALGFSIDSTQAVQATTNLDLMTAAAQRSEQQQNSHARATDILNQQLINLVRTQQEQIAALTSTTNAVKDATTAVQKYTESIQILATLAGTTEQNFRNLQTVLDGTGASLSTQSQIVSRFTSALNSTSDAAKSIRAAIADVGVDISKFKDVASLLEAVRENLNLYADDSRKVALTKSIFGADNADVQKTLDGFTKLTETDKALNSLLDERSRLQKQVADQKRKDDADAIADETELNKQRQLYNANLDISRIKLKQAYDEVSLNPFDGLFSKENATAIDTTVSQAEDYLKAVLQRLTGPASKAFEQWQDDLANKGMFSRIFGGIGEIFNGDAAAYATRNLLGLQTPQGTGDTRPHFQATAAEMVKEFNDQIKDMKLAQENWTTWSIQKEIDLRTKQLEELKQAHGDNKEEIKKYYDEIRTLQRQNAIQYEQGIYAFDRIQEATAFVASRGDIQLRQQQLQKLHDQQRDQFLRTGSQRDALRLGQTGLALTGANVAVEQQGYAIQGTDIRTAQQELQIREQLAQQESQFQIRIHQQTLQQQLEQERQFENQRYELEKQAADNALKAAGGNRAAQASARAQRQTADARHNAAISGFNLQEGVPLATAESDAARNSEIRAVTEAYAGQLPEAQNLAAKLKQIDLEVADQYERDTDRFKATLKVRQDDAREQSQSDFTVQFKNTIGDLTRQNEEQQKLNDANLRGASALSEANIQKALAVERAKALAAGYKDESQALNDLLNQYEQQLRIQQELASQQAAISLRSQFDPTYQRQRSVDDLDLLRQQHPELINDNTYQQRLNQIDEQAKRQQIQLLSSSRDAADGAKAAFLSYSDAASNAGAAVNQAITGGFSHAEDAVAQFVTTGKVSFSGMVNSMIGDLARLAFRMSVLGPVSKWLGGALGLTDGGAAAGADIATSVPAYTGPALDLSAWTAAAANGEVFSRGHITPFAYGGIVTRPTLFPMANGAGLMGEAGPEAVMPLTRGADGRLGVAAHGGNGTQIVIAPQISITGPASGGSTSPASANAIGNEVARQVKDLVVRTLVEQQRPGGVLNPGLSQ